MAWMGWKGHDPSYKYLRNNPRTESSFLPGDIGQPCENDDIQNYVVELRRILESQPNYGTPPEPTLIYDNVYLGTTANADNLALLRRLHITHVYNCAGISSLRVQRESRYGPDSGVVEYNEIPALDEEFYDISAHFTKAHMFMDHARQRGKLLVYCPDVNRSGTIAISFLIRKGYALLRAASLIKHTRPSLLYNKGFMRQLVVFARDHGCLSRSHPHLGASQFAGIGRVKDRRYQGHYLQTY